MMMKLHLYLLICLVVYAVCDSISKDSTPASKIAIELKKFVRTAKKSDALKTAVKELHSIKNRTVRDEQVCQTCRNVVDGVIRYRRAGVGNDGMRRLVSELCNIFTSSNQQVCDGYAAIETDAVLFIIDHKKDLTPNRVCAIYLQYHQCEDISSDDWAIAIPPRVSAAIEIKHDSVQKEATQKVLHLTDIHYDPLYTPGSDAVCELDLCCQGGQPKHPENAAGYWGDYNVCDMPWHSIQNLMTQVKKQHPQIDYIYYTGDIISHRSWATSVEDNSNSIRALFKLFSDTFNNTPLYPILGNHEAHPSDYYAPLDVTTKTNVSTQWLYNLAAEEWSRWLPKEAKETILIGGYYTALVKPGFRIIALNSNVCYTYNLWLIYDDKDPFGELKWLTNTLTAAEKNGEHVHILSHIPPGGTECWRKWSHQFNRIVNRFSNIIKAQFNGHTHLDEIRIFYDDKKERVINVAYNGGSFTTFVGYNPNYRVYDMDSQNLDITDYDQWVYNLTKANGNKDIPPEWYKLYSFKEAYGLNSTSLDDLYDMVQRMKHDKGRELLKQYYRFEVRDSKPKMEEGCNNECLDKLLCSITSVEFEEAVNC